MPDSAYAEWLQVPERTAVRDDAAAVAKWGETAVTWSGSSCFATEAAGIAEADRVQAFAAAPLVEEQITVAGAIDIAALRGRVIAINCPVEAAYSNGADVFCLGGEVDHGTGVTKLAVLRRL